MSMIERQRLCALYARDGFRWKRCRGRIAWRAFHLPDSPGKVISLDAIMPKPHADFVAQSLSMLRAIVERVGLPPSAGEPAQTSNGLNSGIRRIAQQGRALCSAIA